MSKKQIDRSLIDRLDRQGLTAPQIAKRTGCHVDSVRRILMREFGRRPNHTKRVKVTDDELKAAAEAGLIVNEIAEKYHLTNGQVQKRAIRLLGYKLPYAKSRNFRYDRDEIKGFFDEGYSRRDVIEILGIHPDTLARIMYDELGYEKPDPNWMTESELKQIEELLDDGWSYKQVSKFTGRSEHAISERFPDRGWTAEQANEYRRMFRILDSL